MTVTLKYGKLRSEDRNISLKLYHKADWSKINGNIKNKSNRLSGIFDILKRRPTNEIKLCLDELASKLIKIIYYEVEKSIPEIKIKERNTYLSEYIREKIKNKRNLRRLYIQTKDQNIKPTLNSIKKEIKKDINNYREKQLENKLRKIKILYDPKDWRNIKNILGVEKKKTEYPDLTLGNKKAVTNEEKVKLFKQFVESIFITEPEHKISDQEKILIEMDILNNNDLETIELNEHHKDIKIEGLTNMINKLDIKKACGEDKITNKLIKLTYNSTKDFLFKLFNSSLYHGCYPKVFNKITNNNAS